MSSTQMLAGVATFIAVTMTVAFTFLAWTVSDTNKGQQRAFVCFDHAGQVTTGFGQECRYVAIRELGTRTRA